MIFRGGRQRVDAVDNSIRCMHGRVRRTRLMATHQKPKTDFKCLKRRNIFTETHPAADTTRNIHFNVKFTNISRRSHIIVRTAGKHRKIFQRTSVRLG